MVGCDHGTSNNLQRVFSSHVTVASGSIHISRRSRPAIDNEAYDADTALDDESKPFTVAATCTASPNPLPRSAADR